MMQGGVRVELAAPLGEGTVKTKATAAAAALTIDVGETTETTERRIERLISENPVVIFSRKSCCMCHVMKKLLSKIQVHPAVIELEEAELGVLATHDSQDQARADGRISPAPAVFIGGKMVGGLESLMALHLSGQLVPMLRDVGALWM